MTALSATQVSALRGVIEQAPDTAVDRLELFLRDDALAKTMGPMREIVHVEVEERRARTAVFAPIMPLCAPRCDGVRSLSFPRDLPARLWRALKLEAPRKAEACVVLSQRLAAPGEPSPALFDDMCREAARGLRTGLNPEFAAAAEALDAVMPGEAEMFAGLLEVSPIARVALSRLPAWLGHMNEDEQAAVRLAFKDATDVAEDAGLRLMEILFAHLDEPSRVLRLISAVMDRPSETYVAASEMSGFGARILSDIDRRLAEITAMDPDGGAVAGAEAGATVTLVVGQFREFERGVELVAKGPWGQRIAKQKRALASAVEARLKLAVATIDEVLPLKSKARGAVRGMPNLVADPDPRLVRRALALLAFLDGIRAVAAAAGFGRPRAETAEILSAHIDQYVEDLLDMLHGGEAELAQRARAYIDVAAQFLALVTDDKAAEVARRRAAAA